VVAETRTPPTSIGGERFGAKLGSMLHPRKACCNKILVA
jgi:hypothetical protein